MKINKLKEFFENYWVVIAILLVSAIGLYYLYNETIKPPQIQYNSTPTSSTTYSISTTPTTPDTLIFMR
jgi:hypothetical protein